jgi:hypothetical protein
MAEAHGGAFSLQNLDVLGGSGARNGQPDRVRTGVD